MWKVILGIVAIMIFASGFYVMNRLDLFLEHIYDKKEENIKKEPSYVILAEDLSDEAIIKEIRYFKERHDYTGILLYDNRDMIDGINQDRMKEVN